ncbi:MAG: hypothetical protein ABSD42_01660 [Candidatus Bathyarchaeia archaeon]
MTYAIWEILLFAVLQKNFSVGLNGAVIFVGVEESVGVIVTVEVGVDVDDDVGVGVNVREGELVGCYSEMTVKATPKDTMATTKTIIAITATAINF